MAKSAEADRGIGAHQPGATRLAGPAWWRAQLDEAPLDVRVALLIVADLADGSRAEQGSVWQLRGGARGRAAELRGPEGLVQPPDVPGKDDLACCGPSRDRIGERHDAADA